MAYYLPLFTFICLIFGKLYQIAGPLLPSKMADYRPLFTLICLVHVFGKLLDSWTITIKLNVRFQGEIWTDKFQPDEIQNGQLSSIILL